MKIHAQKCITKLCNYEFIVLANLTKYTEAFGGKLVS